MHCPTVEAAPVEVASRLADRAVKGQIAGKPLLACWMGGDGGARGADAPARGGRASYATPAPAAAAVGHLTDWGRAQARAPSGPRPAGGGGAEGRARSGPPRRWRRSSPPSRRGPQSPERAGGAGGVAAYGIPVPDLQVAASPAEAGDIASDMLATGGRLAVKALSRDIGHKSEYGGVVLGVATPAEAEAAAEAIEARLGRYAPRAELQGFALQSMVVRPQAREAILGVNRDPLFGPVILFGAGGVSVELVRDTEIALPPLDAGLAADLIARTRIGRLSERRGRAAGLGRGGARGGARRALEPDRGLPLPAHARHQPDAGGRGRRRGPRRAHRDRPGGHRAAGAQSRPRDPSISGNVAPDDRGQGRPLRAAADPPGGRAALSDVSRAHRPGGSAPALPGAAAALPRGDGAPADPARLRPGDGVPRAHARRRNGGDLPARLPSRTTAWRNTPCWSART